MWAAGDADMQQALPATADAVIPDDEACDSIIAQVGGISEQLWAGEMLARQACFLPNLEGDIPGPVLGPTEVDGLWIAAGHSCWGIQNAPASGKIMSEFIFEGESTSANVGELHINYLSTQ